MKTIRFLANRPWLKASSPSAPSPISKTIPEWYISADRYVKGPSGDYPEMPDIGGKIPTWKSCPAIYDVMASGYTLKTPCDIRFYFDQKYNRIIGIPLDSNYSDFIDNRPEMPQFCHPHGYSVNHFSWMVDWNVIAPEGYSVLYTHPMNRFELPFLSTSGIIDNDKVNLSGSMPFFLVDGWTGVLEAGTPYSQLIPFKRESWESTIEEEPDSEKIKKNIIENANKYRVPNGGVYLNEVWERRTYK